MKSDINLFVVFSTQTKQNKTKTVLVFVIIQTCRNNWNHVEIFTCLKFRHCCPIIDRRPSSSDNEQDFDWHWLSFSETFRLRMNWWKKFSALDLSTLMRLILCQKKGKENNAFFPRYQSISVLSQEITSMMKIIHYFFYRKREKELKRDRVSGRFSNTNQRRKGKNENLPKHTHTQTHE